eukprot:CAMPEP_0198120542 /NCGR_PEP_ID=MMETSP1442-20131203/29387_1 /TAXON_ID= /ORGANISM="Craspedostauros australis, Strain CCMP3328" /LENGTH=272 /DNA_ID=CAMNT_0043779203 /DNA_START=314 /DNA_END=1132 /DNA_ORIENTATION=+
MVPTDRVSASHSGRKHHRADETFAHLAKRVRSNQSWQMNAPMCEQRQEQDQSHRGGSASSLGQIDEIAVAGKPPDSISITRRPPTGWHAFNRRTTSTLTGCSSDEDDSDNDADVDSDESDYNGFASSNTSEVSMKTGHTSVCKNMFQPLRSMDINPQVPQWQSRFAITSTTSNHELLPSLSSTAACITHHDTMGQTGNENATAASLAACNPQVATIDDVDQLLVNRISNWSLRRFEEPAVPPSAASSSFRRKQKQAKRDVMRMLLSSSSRKP